MCPSIFDKLKPAAGNVNGAGMKTGAAGMKKTFVFSSLPESLAQMQALPEAELQDPFQAAALTDMARSGNGGTARMYGRSWDFSCV